MFILHPLGPAKPSLARYLIIISMTECVSNATGTLVETSAGLIPQGNRSSNRSFRSTTVDLHFAVISGDMTQWPLWPRSSRSPDEKAAGQGLSWMNGR